MLRMRFTGGEAEWRPRRPRAALDERRAGLAVAAVRALYPCVRVRDRVRLGDRDGDRVRSGGGADMEGWSGGLIVPAAAVSL